MPNTRRYPRTARINEVVREVVADEVERLADPRLGFVTITGAHVSPDLRHATIYYSVLETKDAKEDQRQQTLAGLRSSARHIRAVLGHQVRMKYSPQLSFEEDPAIETGARVDQIIREFHREP
jgi:ribosome-binding factor A